MATAAFPTVATWQTAPPHHYRTEGQRLAAPPLNLPRIAKTAALLVAFMLLNKLGTVGSLAFFAVLVVMVLRSPRHAFQAITICSLALMINPVFVPKTLVWTPGRLVLPIVAMLRFAFDLVNTRGVRRGMLVYGTLVFFCAVMALCSVLSSWYTHIALLKLFNFWACMSAILFGTMVLRVRRIDLSEWVVSFIVAATFFGLLALATGNHDNWQRAGANIRGRFVGAFIHPNTHAAYASVFVTYLAAVGIFSSFRRRWFVLPCIGVWLLFMIWSASRTSLVATTAGLVVLVAYAQPFRNRWGWRVRSNVRRGTLLAGLLLGLAGLTMVDLALGGPVWRQVVGFITKGQQSEVLEVDDILRSRQGLIDSGWSSFLESPMYGIGFGVAKTEAFVSTATLFSAPVEKGFLPTALLEEGGVLGTTAFVIFLCTLIGSLAWERNVPALAMLAAILGCNLTEVSLFSPGGTGLFCWTMVGASMMLGDRCWVPTRGPAMVMARPTP